MSQRIVPEIRDKARAARINANSVLTLIGSIENPANDAPGNLYSIMLTFGTKTVRR